MGVILTANIRVYAFMTNCRNVIASLAVLFLGLGVCAAGAVPPPESPSNDLAPIIEQLGRSPIDNLARWIGSLTSNDSPAQWVIAFTGVFALLLSVWAVWLLKATLVATREAVKSANDAVEVTRDLGEAQIRAYLYCRSAKYKRSREHIDAIVEIGNSGQSPASDVSINGCATFYEVLGMRRMPRVCAYATSSHSEAQCQPIFPNGRIVGEITFFREHDFPTEDDEADDDVRQNLFDDGNQIWFDLTVRWRDVFGNMHEFPLNLGADIGPTPTNPNKARSLTGKLDFTMEDTRHRLPVGTASDEAQ